MELERLDYGSFIATDDPGEPGTSAKRISITDEEARLLRVLATDRMVLEIGTGLGIATRALADQAIWVTTIDVDPWVHAKIFPSVKRSNVRCRPDRDRFEPTVDRFDFAFIDGEHTYHAVCEDLAFAQRHMPAGIIAFHDTKTVSAVADALNDVAKDWVEIDTYHGIGLVVAWDSSVTV